MSQPKLSLYERWYGRDEPPPEVVPLRAGRLSAVFQDGDLRCLRYGSQELIRRIYIAVRDHNWNTIPGRIDELEIEAGGDSFKITFLCRHNQGAVDFRWRASLEGTAGGELEFSMDGIAGSAFRYNRIGFCVLHPIQGIAGQPFQAVTPGGMVSGSLPDQIAPQLIINGFEAPIFPSCSSLAITLADGSRLVTSFEGDLFEMEDQRNWTDGSFKTYCTPLSLGYPHQAQAGQAFFQRVAVRLEAAAPLVSEPVPSHEPHIRLAVGGETGRRLPRLGFGLPAEETEPGEGQTNRIARLRPDHLKTELHLGDPGWPAQLERARQSARQMNSPLELALFLDDHPEEALSQLNGRLDGIDLARVIVFHEAEAARAGTSPPWMKLARQALSARRPGLPFVGGTNGNFAQLNRRPPDPSLMDGVSYTLNPQVHAFDESSLIEAIEAQRDSVISAKMIAAGLPVSVSSVTLKPPFNAAATEAEGQGDPNQLPSSVDRRQMSLFAAAWTVGSLHALTLGGADSVTYYETTGWRGLVETGQGSRLPAQFRSFPGMIFPVYWVFAHLAGAKGAELLQTDTEKPLQAGVLALRKNDRVWLLVVNYQPKDQVVILAGLPSGQFNQLRLNEDTFATAAAAAAAAADPEMFLAGAAPVETAGHSAAELTLYLKPYETALLAAKLNELPA